MLADLTHSFRIDAADLPGENVLFGRTAAMQEVRRRIELALREDLPVLIQGESGTGKEVIAKYLHVRSRRARQAFVKLSCVALTESLFEVDFPGCADAGTLFLDEISDMDRKLHEELIHSLSSRCGAQVAGRARAGVVCSTRIDSEPIATGGASGPDLKGDLIRLHLPALRERKQDIPQLCDFLMQRQARRFGKDGHELTPGTLQLLKQWQWPGNLRELENWVARVVILGSQEALAAELRDQIALDGTLGEEDAAGGSSGSDPWRASSASRVAAIVRVLHAHGWSRRRAAQELRISYRALLCRLRDANLPMHRRRRSHHRESPPTR